MLRWNGKVSLKQLNKAKSILRPTSKFTNPRNGCVVLVHHTNLVHINCRANERKSRAICQLLQKELVSFKQVVFYSYAIGFYGDGKLLTYNFLMDLLMHSPLLNEKLEVENDHMSAISQCQHETSDKVAKAKHLLSQAEEKSTRTHDQARNDRKGMETILEECRCKLADAE